MPSPMSQLSILVADMFSFIVRGYTQFDTLLCFSYSYLCDNYYSKYLYVHYMYIVKNEAFNLEVRVGTGSTNVKRRVHLKTRSCLSLHYV